MSVNVNKNYTPSGDVGVEYAITNSKGVTHILMGTLHAIDAKSLRNLCLDRILQCTELFTEAGTIQPLQSSSGCFPGIKKYNIPYPHKVDDFINIMAAWRKIPIKSLDQQIPEMQETIAEIVAARQMFGVEAFGDSMDLHNYRTQTSLPLKEMEELHRLIQAYQQGNLNVLQEMREKKGPRDNLVVNLREDKWSEILISKLLDSDKPIGIAVGVLHVCGKGSLSERFAQAGMKVELITPKPSNGYFSRAAKTVNAWLQGQSISSQPRSRL